MTSDRNLDPELTRPSRKLRPRALGGILTLAVLTAGVGAAGVVAGSAPAFAEGNAVVVNAAQDSAGAHAALAKLPNATDATFTPTSAPNYSQSEWSDATDSAIHNPAGSGAEAGKDLTTTYSAGSSWSLGGSVEVGYGLKALGLANTEVSMKFTAEHQWNSETSDTNTIYATAKPGEDVWIAASHSQATFTGTYTFTTDNVHYTVTDVTITEPAALPDNAGDTNSGITYAVVAMDNTKSPAPAGVSTNKASLVPMKKLPEWTSYTKHMPKLTTNQH